MKLSQLEKRIQQILTNLKDIIQKGWNYLRWSGWARSTLSQANETWALYKSNPSRKSWGDLSRNWYITCPKVSLPCWKRAIVHFSTSSLGLFRVLQVCQSLLDLFWESFTGFYIWRYPTSTILAGLFIVGVRILWKKIALEREQGGWDAISCLLPGVEGEFEQIIMKLHLSFKGNNN